MMLKIFSSKKSKEDIIEPVIGPIQGFTPEQNNFIRPAINRLLFDYGLVNSINENACVDCDKNPIPWYTYPAIDFLKQLDLSEKKVFEFGCGNSSKFWAGLAKEVISVEEKEEWYEICLKDKKNNQTILNCVTEESYTESILNYSNNFDVIIVDGDFSRFKCTQNAIKKVNDGGLIILDNSDRAEEFEVYSNATKLLREKGFIQVDMSGFGPLNNFTWTTSFFFHRNYNFLPKNHQIQPMKATGNIRERFSEEYNNVC